MANTKLIFLMSAASCIPEPTGTKVLHRLRGELSFRMQFTKQNEHTKKLTSVVRFLDFDELSACVHVNNNKTGHLFYRSPFNTAQKGNDILKRESLPTHFTSTNLAPTVTPSPFTAVAGFVPQSGVELKAAIDACIEPSPSAGPGKI